MVAHKLAGVFERRMVWLEAVWPAPGGPREAL
jgi:hypothetical protein